MGDRSGQAQRRIARLPREGRGHAQVHVQDGHEGAARAPFRRERDRRRDLSRRRVQYVVRADRLRRHRPHEAHAESELHRERRRDPQVRRQGAREGPHRGGEEGDHLSVPGQRLARRIPGGSVQVRRHPRRRPERRHSARRSPRFAGRPRARGVAPPLRRARAEQHGLVVREEPQRGRVFTGLGEALLPRHERLLRQRVGLRRHLAAARSFVPARLRGHRRRLHHARRHRTAVGAREAHAGHGDVRLLPLARVRSRALVQRVPKPFVQPARPSTTTRGWRGSSRSSIAKTSRSS